MAAGINSLSYLKLVSRKILLHCCHLQCPLLPPWRLVLLCLLLCASVTAVTRICRQRGVCECVRVCARREPTDFGTGNLNLRPSQGWMKMIKALSLISRADKVLSPPPAPQSEAGLSVGIPTSKPLAEADRLLIASACPAACAEYR